MNKEINNLPLEARESATVMTEETARDHALPWMEEAPASALAVMKQVLASAPAKIDQTCESGRVMMEEPMRAKVTEVAMEMAMAVLVCVFARCWCCRPGAPGSRAKWRVQEGGRVQCYGWF